MKINLAAFATLLLAIVIPQTVVYAQGAPPGQPYIQVPIPGNTWGWATASGTAPIPGAADQWLGEEMRIGGSPVAPNLTGPVT
jgi:hypothetical protein